MQSPLVARLRGGAGDGAQVCRWAAQLAESKRGQRSSARLLDWHDAPRHMAVLPAHAQRSQYSHTVQSKRGALILRRRCCPVRHIAATVHWHPDALAVAGQPCHHCCLHVAAQADESSVQGCPKPRGVFTPVQHCMQGAVRQHISARLSELSTPGQDARCYCAQCNCDRRHRQVRRR